MISQELSFSLESRPASFSILPYSRARWSQRVTSAVMYVQYRSSSDTHSLCLHVILLVAGLAAMAFLLENQMPLMALEPSRQKLVLSVMEEYHGPIVAVSARKG